MSSPTCIAIPDGVMLKYLTSSDIPQLRDLHGSLLPLTYPPSFFRQFLIFPDRLCILACHSASPSIPVAFITARIHTSSHESHQKSSSEPRIEILTLDVSQQYRRRGVARGLVYAAVYKLRDTVAFAHWSAAEGICVTAHTTVSNTGTRKFCEALGIRVTEVIDEFYRTLPHNQRDALLLVGRIQ